MPIIPSTFQPTVGDIVDLEATDHQDGNQYIWVFSPPASPPVGTIYGPEALTDTNFPKVSWDTGGLSSGDYDIDLTITDAASPPNVKMERLTLFLATGKRIDARPLDVRTTLARSAAAETRDQALWVAIRDRTRAISFDVYADFVEAVLCQGTTPLPTSLSSPPTSPPSGHQLPLRVMSQRTELDQFSTIHGVDAYNLLRLATEAFLMLECGVKIEGLNDPKEESGRLNRTVTPQELLTQLGTYLGAGHRLPYLERIVKALLGSDQTTWLERLPYCDGILQYRLTCPSLLELIWSYWHEEGMLTQTINAVALRFQNKRRNGRDPLARLEIDPLRPLNNLIWGYIQAEHTRLSVIRRTYEYDHHYGLTLLGKAIPALRTADSRPRFLETYHNLLSTTAAFYKADSDTTVVADAFPVLNALKDLHLILAEGAHNQYGDLPWTARVEMLIEQWLLARPEMAAFLGGRAMVPYRERWMGQVDTMKKLQGWTPTTVTHFRDLGAFGEQLLLSVRYGDWSDVTDENQAKNWARYWKPEVQGYIHAYRAVTGVDLASEPASEADLARRRALPSALLAQQMAVPMAKLPAPARGLSTG